MRKLVTIAATPAPKSKARGPSRSETVIDILTEPFDVTKKRVPTRSGRVLFSYELADGLALIEDSNGEMHLNAAPSYKNIDKINNALSKLDADDDTPAKLKKAELIVNDLIKLAKKGSTADSQSNEDIILKAKMLPANFTSTFKGTPCLFVIDGTKKGLDEKAMVMASESRALIGKDIPLDKIAEVALINPKTQWNIFHDTVMMMARDIK